MYKNLKHFIERILPKRFLPISIIERKIAKITGNKIAEGPFKDMIWEDCLQETHYGPYILGTYEKELTPILEKLCAEPFRTVVDVGAGHGYFACGLALRLPNAKIIAFEMEDKRRSYCARICAVNRVEHRVKIFGLCNRENLIENLKVEGLALVMMDVEGAERELLDPAVISRLRQCHILVELHEFVYPDIADLITNRFQASHIITEIQSRPRNYNDFPNAIATSVSFLPKKYLTGMLDEHRPGMMRWFYLKPKS